jgi:hypothetical protein
MTQAMRICLIGVTALWALSASSTAAAEESKAIEVAPIAVAAVAVTAVAPVAAVHTAANALGIKPLDRKMLAAQRGGADVFNDMQLKGVVANNQAVNVSTGNNGITDGAFAGAAGMPMVVQNTGNNVLIQNATIVNVQVK